MKKVIFTLEGKRFEVELEDEFATYVTANLLEHDISLTSDNRATQFIKLYLTAMKENYESSKQIKILINKTKL